MSSRSKGAAVRAVSQRFKRATYFKWFAAGKLWLDPAFEELAGRLQGEQLPLLDLGCGLGVLGFYLRERGCDFDVFAVDTDEKKVEAGSKVAAGSYPGVRLEVGDARATYPFSGNVAILDVIHYFDDEARTAALLSASEMVAPGGRLFLRTAIRDGSLRYWITYAEDVLTRSIGWINGAGHINFPTVDEVAEPMQERGFTFNHQPLWGPTPFNSYLFEFRREG